MLKNYRVTTETFGAVYFCGVDEKDAEKNALSVYQFDDVVKVEQMPYYYDERGYYVSIEELEEEFDDLLEYEFDEYGHLTLEDYIDTCTDKNGTLEKRWNI